ncbi:MAG TPA: hypothetical protein VGL72_15260 [Bryobacteraceae bacterium]|jgi:hypothetical protein
MMDMFFRRQQPKAKTFDDYMNQARSAGFTVERMGGGRVRISRDGAATVVEGTEDGTPRFTERAGVMMGQEIASLVDGGYQKFMATPLGKRRPALASDLNLIHNFQEDLREALGLTSLYNESLGTVSNKYLYDRVVDRDRGVPVRPWEA